jgi:hypothetical protein
MEIPIVNDENGTAALIMCKDVEMPGIPRAGDQVNTREVLFVTWNEDPHQSGQWHVALRLESIRKKTWEACTELADDLRRGGWEELSDRAQRILRELGLGV